MKQFLGGASQQILLIHVDGTLQNPQVRREAFPGVNQVLEQLQAELQRPLAPARADRRPPTRRRRRERSRSIELERYVLQ